MMKRLSALPLLALSCGPVAPLVDAGPSLGPRVFATTNTDENTSGSLASVTEEALRAQRDIGPAEQVADSVLAWHDDRLVLMSTGNGYDNLTLLDVSASSTRVIAQLPASVEGEMGAGDARDYLALDDHRGYVARLAQSRLGIVDWTAHTTTASSVDLGALRGRGTLPWVRSLARVGSEVWVMLERLTADFEHPDETGLVVRIDPATDTVIDQHPGLEGPDTIPLLLPDPVGHFAISPDGRTVYVACVGSYQDATNGGVVAIDVATHTARVVVAEAMVQGNIDAVLALTDDRLLLRVSPAIVGTAPQASVSLVAWSLAAGTATPWLTVAHWSLTEPVLARDGRVYVGDRGDEATARPAGIRVFDPADGHEVTSAPIDVGALPYDLRATP